MKISRTQTALGAALAQPTLSASRALEEVLRREGFENRVFGRVNQKASLEANSESDRGIAERLANAFDASLTAARLAVGIASTKDLTPRKAAQRLFSPTKDRCEWKPPDKRVSFGAPSIQFWLEHSDAKVRYKRYHTAEGLCTVLVHDFGMGIARDVMPSTILDLNSDSKLRAFEAIGQFGHGGSSSLAFCESALIVSQSRFAKSDDDEFCWTLVVPERVKGDSKQDLVRHWFCEPDGFPFREKLTEFPALKDLLPGTAVWHFGYSRGGWIKAIAGPEQTNPWGRLGRLFFSYPLPFSVRGELARTDSTSGQRLLKGAFFRLIESESVEYSSGERSQSIVLGNTRFGEFHVFYFVLKEGSSVRDYVDPNHPIIGTLNGQNHGEMTRTLVNKAGLPELSTSMIIEMRLDALDVEAQSNIINNSREAFKRTEFTRELESRLLAMLEEDDVLKDLELARQEKKAREASVDMSKRLSAFLSAILSDAKGRPAPSIGSQAPGNRHKEPRPRPSPLPEVPPADPPVVIEFLYSSPLSVPEGSTKLAKFRSDARAPKYSFYGDNPRLFAELRAASALRDRISVSGKADINQRGYGSVSVTCVQDDSNPIQESIDVGELHLTLQSASGRTLHAVLPIRVAPKPPESGRRREPDVHVELHFSTSNPAETDELKHVFAEDHVSQMGPDLEKKAEDLGLPGDSSTYTGDRSDRHGESVLRVEINAGNQRLRELMASCATAEEKALAKERYCQDVVLDCYQHEFELDSVPEVVTFAVTTHREEEIRAAETYLNHDKAVRFALAERERDRKSRG